MDNEKLAKIENRVLPLLDQIFAKVTLDELIPAIATLIHRDIFEVLREIDLIEAFNPDKLTWLDKNGANGPFDLCNKTSDPEYQKMFDFLKNQAGGKTAYRGMFYWIFPDEMAVGRKPSRGRGK